ncbi:hypothetical protein SAMN02745194_02490 [Roseomonas rosea]|uniref:Uncharacterized protein n=1 Tax=Muricoccus roseus TaxID=198092 RepID=A0A1M6J1U0_9PROT|nr:hypothetical protein [Roseomonas rosea]SHJ40636.1 hypothetical protein SAMN02745194_02490 [Roseomonas rosea]
MAWTARAERDVDATIRLSTEFFGDIPLREIAREMVRKFRSHQLHVCSEWGQAAEYADSTDPKDKQKMRAGEAPRISRSRPRPTGL